MLKGRRQELPAVLDDADQLAHLKAALADSYRVERELGHGGMATVYLAEDLKHRRRVAIKVLRPELAAALGPERFLREIELLAGLTHPHILPLHDSGNADGFLYYVMPYVEGESLRDWLTREKQLPLDDALQIAREVADALSYAHSHGVIHRDIKPENILLESGHAVVADFGIARAIDQAGGEKLTESGVALGTPAYMSPEQATGSRDLDGRSDLYSLGCVLYEMLAGRPPFVGPTRESVVHQQLAAEPPSITSLRPAVPAGVVAALSRALAKTPADRFNPVALFGEALLPRPSAPVSPDPLARGAIGLRSSWRHRGLIGVGVLVVLAGAIALGRWLRPSATGSHHPRTAIAVLPFQNLSADTSHAYLAGGLQDEVLTQLAKVAALKVVSRTSVMGYAGASIRPLRQIARELGVGSIVEGTVQVVGDRLRVNVQLIDAATDEHLWADQYNRTLDDAFAIQSDVAQQIVAAVGATLTGAERTAIAAAPTQNAEAYRLYLQGEEYRHRPEGSRQELESAEQLYERALSLDSTFALAYASLSNVHGTLYWFRIDPYPSRLERAREAAEAAIRFAPDLPQAHWAMGMVHYWRERDFARAVSELTSAAKALPGSGELWSYVGYVHRRLGNWDEVLEAFAKASALDPRDAQLLWDLGGNTFQLLHRYAEAISANNRALDLAPDTHGARLNNARIYLEWHGELDSLRSTLQRGPEDYGYLGSADLWRVHLALWQRQPERLLALLSAPETVMFEAQAEYAPGRLYAGWGHQLRHDRAAATRAFTGALAQLDSALRRLPDDWRLHASRGLALAGLGRASAARKEAEWLTRSRAYRDHYDGPYLSAARAMVFAQLVDARKAAAELEPLLAGPSWTSAPMVRLDPRYDPIRGDPRFQALLVKYASPGPVR